MNGKKYELFHIIYIILILYNNMDLFEQFYREEGGSAN